MPGQVNVLCEWCGSVREDMPAYPVETLRGWMTDPFHKREAKFFACSEPCKTRADEFYAEYRKNVRTWAGGCAGIFGLSFVTGILFGHSVFRWVLPAAIGLGGIWFIRFPYFNNFRRDPAGSLKNPLHQTRRIGRIAGILFVLIAAVLLYINTCLPPLIAAP